MAEIKVEINNVMRPELHENLLEAMIVAVRVACSTPAPDVKVFIDNKAVCLVQGKWRIWYDLNASGEFSRQYFRAYNAWPVNGRW
jgi:hypothetical protein